MLLFLGFLAAGCAVAPSRSGPEFWRDIPLSDPPQFDVPDNAVYISVDTDAAWLVSRGTAGTTYVFEPGVHRLKRPITPHDGDRFLGSDGAVLSGASEVLPSGREAGLWFIDNLSLDISVHGVCDPSSPRCTFRHDLFLDDAVLRHVATRQEVVPGTWFYELDTRRAFFADDPTGRRLELSFVPAAFQGTTDDVVITKLVIERFANYAQWGAIMAERISSSHTFGERWIIASNEVRQNHGVGIRAGSGAWIVDNFIHHNGQLGVSSFGPGMTRIESNEISNNNYAGYSQGWEAGGGKFFRTDGLLVRSNFVHHNIGAGLWTDIDNVNTVYEYNIVEYNSGSGIFHEISYDAIIRFNVSNNNGVGIGDRSYAYVFGAGILVANSSFVIVHDNVVQSNWNGIVGLQQTRGDGALGPWVLRGLHVFNNRVSMSLHVDGIDGNGHKGVAAVSGVVQDHGDGEVFREEYGNRFESNHYEVGDLDVRHFAWGNSWLVFEDWQQCAGQVGLWAGCQQDASGSISRTSQQVIR